MKNSNKMQNVLDVLIHGIPGASTVAPRKNISEIQKRNVNDTLNVVTRQTGNNKVPSETQDVNVQQQSIIPEEQDTLEVLSPEATKLHMEAMEKQEEQEGENLRLLRQGVIMAEILQEPVCKRRHRRRS